MPPPPKSPSRLRARVTSILADRRVLAFKRFLSYIFTCVALYTIAKHVRLGLESYTAKLVFAPRRADAESMGTCVPLFDRASALPAGSSILYSYAQNTPLLRVCTNLTGAELDTAMGGSYRYDPLALVVPGCSYPAAAASCDSDASMAPEGNCSTLLRYDPAAPGTSPRIHWTHAFTKSASPASCAPLVYKSTMVGSITPACALPFVHSLIQVDVTKMRVTYVALAAFALRLLFELAAVGAFCWRGRKAPAYGVGGGTAAGWWALWCWAFLQGGILGAPFEAFAYCALGTGAPRMDVHPAVSLVVLLFDLLTHAAIPITAVAGCAVTEGMALNIAQLVAAFGLAALRFGGSLEAWREHWVEARRAAVAGPPEGGKGGAEGGALGMAPA